MGDEPRQLEGCVHRNDPPSSQLGYRNCMVGTKGMEEVETFAKVATGRFLERTLCDLVWAGIGQVDKMFAPAEELSLGGHQQQRIFRQVRHDDQAQ